MKRRILFLCTHNSARSQMAQGWLNHLGGSLYEAHSAGTEATLVRPFAIEVMREAGVDISHHTSKTLERYIGQRWDAVITVCDDAEATCPVFPGAARRLHWSFPDPSRATGDDEARRGVFRATRDAIRVRIEAFLAAEP